MRAGGLAKIAVGAGYARERGRAEVWALFVGMARSYGRMCSAVVRALHHRGVDSIMRGFAVDGFPEFLCSRP